MVSVYDKKMSSGTLAFIPNSFIWGRELAAFFNYCTSNPCEKSCSSQFDHRDYSLSLLFYSFLLVTVSLFLGSSADVGLYTGERENERVFDESR